VIITSAHASILERIGPSSCLVLLSSSSRRFVPKVSCEEGKGWRFEIWDLGVIDLCLEFVYLTFSIRFNCGQGVQSCPNPVLFWELASFGRLVDECVCLCVFVCFFLSFSGL